MRVLKIVLVFVFAAVAFGGGYLLRDRRPAGPATGERRVLHYVDPMHPSYTSDRPGVAPDCGMDLEPVYADDPPRSDGPVERAVLYYRDPTATSYTSTTAGVNPATGSRLEPIYARAASTPHEPGAIRISMDRQQLAGVRYGTAEFTEVGRTLRTAGSVSYDETRLQHVHARTDGWIEKVFVNFTGQVVRAGQPMLTIYSPEMVASQEELLLARRARDTMRKSPLAGASDQGESLFQAARRRLQLWRLADAQVEQVLATGTPIRDITLHAPAGGFVLQRNAFPNQRVTADTDLYTLADLSTVWVMADLFEADLSAIRTGAAARIVLPSGTGTTTIAAKVTSVQPAVDPTTRTLQVRLDVRNTGMRLRPGMFVDVEFPLGGQRRLTVPAGAVLDSGDRQVVFVDLGDGYLAPREVQTGERAGDRLVVTSGLTEGARIVATGTFLVDAESQLTSALGSPAGHQHGAAPAVDPAPPGRTPPAPAPASAPGQTRLPAPAPVTPAGHVHD